MTNLVRRTIRCPYCQERVSILTYASINATLNPKLIDQFLSDSFFSTCPSCHREIRLNLHILINAPLGMFSMASNSTYTTKLDKLKEYGVMRTNPPALSVKQKIAEIEQQTSKKITVHLHSYTPKKRYTKLEEMILRFASVLRSKRYNNTEIDFSDWLEFDDITKKILEKMKKNQKPEKKGGILYKDLPFKKDGEIMKGWLKIKTYMAEETRPEKARQSFATHERVDILQLQKI